MDTLQIDDSVVVKDGIKDLDFGIDMGGWQGYIVDIFDNADGTTSVKIEWDSLTLKKMPENTFIESEFNGYDWCVYNLHVTDVTRAEPCDTLDDVEEIQASIYRRYGWVSIGDTKEQGLLIQNVVNSANGDSEMETFKAWKIYLEANLQFPYRAEVYESQHPASNIRQGDFLRVRGLVNDIDDMYGIIAKVQQGRSTFQFPLCDLIPVEEKSTNHYHAHSYNLWFANR